MPTSGNVLALLPVLTPYTATSAQFDLLYPYALDEFKKAVEEELAAEEPSVIIARRPCILLPQVKTAPPLHVGPDKCKSCRQCMKIGCPAVSFADKKSSIDPTLCVGCGLCRQMCKFGAILDKEGN